MLAAAVSKITTTSLWFCKALAGQFTDGASSIIALTASALFSPVAINNNLLIKTNIIDVEKALPDAVVYCNKEGKIQWVNDKASEVFETSKMHLLTSNIGDFLENAQNLITSAVLSNQQVITKFISKEIYFDMTVNEIEDGYVMAFRDAVNASAFNSEPTEEEILRQNRVKNNFLLKISNEFKSPLQSIVGFSQAMTDGLGGEMSEQQNKYIRIIFMKRIEVFKCL